MCIYCDILGIKTTHGTWVCHSTIYCLSNSFRGLLLGSLTGVLVSSGNGLLVPAFSFGSVSKTMIHTISKVDSDMPKVPNKSCSKYWLLTCVRVRAMGFTKSTKVVKTYIVVASCYLHVCCARGGTEF